jgi:acyl-CoA synthetase (NDP forming)
VIAQTLSDPGVDAVIVTHVPPIHDVNDRLIESMKRLAPSATKPMLAVVLAHESAPIVNSHNSYGMPAHGSVPVFADAESAVRSLRLVVDYVEWLRQPRGSAPDFSDIEKQRARALVADVLGSELVAGAAHRLDDIRMRELLESYGMDLWPSLLVASEHEAVRAAEFLGYPVVLKTTAHRLMHRLDLGGLRVTLENEAAVRTAYMSMVATLTSDASASLVVQQMAPPGVACAITTSEDPLFGPIVTFRLGGAIPVILGDDGYRIPPLTSEDAAALVRAPKASRLLFGEHADGTLGEPILAVSALESLLARVGELADDLPELSQLELNPVVLHAKGVVVLGANATVCKPEIRTDLEARRLQ